MKILYHNELYTYGSFYRPNMTVFKTLEEAEREFDVLIKVALKEKGDTVKMIKTVMRGALIVSQENVKEYTRTRKGVR